MSSKSADRLLITVIAVLFGAIPCLGQVSSELPQEYVTRLTDLLQQPNPSAFVATGTPLLKDAKSDLDPSYYDLVVASVAGGARMWLLQEGTLTAATPEAIDALLKWGGKRLTRPEQRDLARSWLLVQDGASRLLATSVATLGKWAEGEFTAEERNQLLQSIAAASPPLQAMTFKDLDDRMRKTVYLTDRTYESTKQRREYVAQWARVHNIAELDAASLNRLVLHYLPTTIPDFEELEAEWNGQVTAPQTGDYTFSVSPIVISTSYDRVSHRQQMSVSVGGQQVVSVTPEDWASTGTPIQLTAGQAVPLRVVLTYSVENAEPRVAPAMLYWSGPGFPRQLVPTSALTVPNGSQNGLLAKVRWKEPKKSMDDPQAEHFDEAIVPNIDEVFWGSTLCTYGDVLDSAVALKISHLLSPQYLVNELVTIPLEAGKPAQRHAFVLPLPHRGLLRMCGSAERQECARKLLENPEVYRNATVFQMLMLYVTMRFGAENESLDLLGSWMQFNANLPPRLAGTTGDFFETNRRTYRRATMALAWEHPESGNRLAAEFLEMPNGECSLPAAYTLAYVYLVQDKFDEWLTLLENKLADETLVDDRRVNWLIARAQAEEIRRSPATRHYTGRENPLAGMAWLEEAALVATSSAVQFRVTQERLTRVAALQQWDAWNEQIQAAQQRFAGNGNAQAELAAWQERVQEIQDNLAVDAEQQDKAAKDSQLARLKKRLEQATSRGDAAGEQRLTELINQLQSQPNE